MRSRTANRRHADRFSQARAARAGAFPPPARSNPPADRRGATPAPAADPRKDSPPVAQAEIIIVDDALLPQAVEIHNAIFRPKREADFFKRRFMGRYNAL